uniref:Protein DETOXIFICATION n=1 Tax=Leersia perrieri TaxID=77586 RepID=A0A0D9VVT5_9ORYZ
MGTGSDDQYPPLLSSAADAAACAGGGRGAHGGSEELERVLGDETVPAARRLARAARVELRMLVALAAPAVAVYMINYAMSMSTRIMCGHLGTLELAAASLGNVGIRSSPTASW